ncbi:Holliday junction resolvase RuvX [Aestuariicella hydrocarbonica]|uniref:Putative pre-16S rRNA nuclease n=1 Tax=Pseudomaricurvus hydrocarbonicus TaxID=1470433 RepID=A0A9E5T2A1_9GAMM|nr:Holliday junction resolvase RuvX [Aestuariicella hydrocarbonica]NHO67636.1 Holliday junction resolvase RuvX [Aestuariicella hydrocarbonica]
MPQSLLAFDYGTQNIGVASGQSLTQSCSELPALKARDGIPNWDDVGKLLQEWQPDLVLVGLPLNMDDSESELSTRARKFGNRLHGRFGVQVQMVDERLSTFAAKEEAAERGHKGNYGQAPIDSIAARLILESWFNQHG